ncbi:MAG TPA: energy-coupling factor ABC transporter permease [Anaerolineaceae bacterium]|nr:energy-coupling factor ABC transporter permease [Anaerolineaceae bacterium]HPN50475.1 energy-coupling factor ABC transporter permease [Anaerolineaceae bacterium]
MFFSPQPMHIPDGFLSVVVSVILWIISLGILFQAVRKTNGTLKERDIPLMGVLAAAIFAGQMLNFPVGGGTSGHLLGAAIAVILLGPWPAVLVMTSVVAVQALLFQDGGLLALGGNILNMAAAGVFVAHFVYTLLRRLTGEHKWGLFVSGFAAAWASIFIAALACALELALSGTSPADVAVPAMAAIHAVIGIGEGLITTGALAFIFTARRDLLEGNAAAQGQKPVLIGGALLSLALVILSPLASTHPDGLEWVAEQKGFLESARGALYEIIPDYVMPGISNEALATILAGAVGAAVVFALAYFTARRSKSKTA